jgi:hypothetical protein
VEKALGAHVSRLGVSLYKFLGNHTHAFRKRERLCGAFRQHPSRYIRLDKVTSHCNDALGVQLDELRVIHLKVGPCSIFDPALRLPHRSHFISVGYTT